MIGLELGADDYVTKPFSPRELVLRVDSVLRRVGGSRARRGVRVVDGDLVVDPARHVATRDGGPLALTAREFDLLRFLVGHTRKVAFSRDAAAARGLGLVVRRRVDGHGARPPAAGEGRGRPDAAPSGW